MSEGKKMTSSRRHHLKSLMLQIAANWLEQEAKDIAAAKEAYMEEKCPAPDLSGDLAALQDSAKKLLQALDKIDEDRYDAEAKVAKTDKEIEELKLKVVELAGVKKPALKKVRMSADAMLQALLGGKHKVTMDLRANLKQVKKEVKEEAADGVGDWRKNIEDKADRKKMFERLSSVSPPSSSSSSSSRSVGESLCSLALFTPVKGLLIDNGEESESRSAQGKKMTSSRRHHLKSLMLQIAASWIEQEKKDIEAAKQTYMSENCPTPDTSGDQAALMEVCKKLQASIDKIDEARYDAEAKVQKADKEIEDLKLKVVELAGVKKPALKKVRMSADAMLQALLGGKHKVTMDLRANLKQVKKEVKEESTEAVGDWRKNIEDKADRKKMFETS
ncbi:uncharacterized protein ABDE67_006833 [Symphorus nematophorus]